MQRFFTKSLLLAALAAFTVSCSGDDADTPVEQPQEPSIDYTKHAVNVTDNQGVVMEITTDGDDGQPLEIVQTIPSFSNSDLGYAKASKGVGATLPSTREAALGWSPSRAVGNELKFPGGMPIVLFFNDKLFFGSIEASVEVYADGNKVFGSIFISEGANGYAILSFTPWKEFTVNSTIEIIVRKTILDKNGNGMTSDYVIRYSVSQQGSGAFDTNRGFEHGLDGVTLLGDAAIVNGGTAGFAASEGECYAAMSSGDKLVSPDGKALGDASSSIMVGPVNKKISTLSFAYDFASAEFNDYVGSKYDDTAIVTVCGPRGSHSYVLATVNTIGKKNSQFSHFHMPDTGDNYAGHIGWTDFSCSIPDVGTPAYITFTVTDVSDHVFSSILLIDDIKY